MSAEDIGGIKGEAELDVSGITDGAKKVGQAVDQMSGSMQKGEQALNQVEQAGRKAGESFDAASIASKALSYTLGALGANSIAGVISRMQQLGREALQLAVNLTGVESRAKAIFGSAFPQMQAAADKMAAAFKRSSSNMLEFITGFGTILDGVGLASTAVNKYSQDLTQLTVVLGKAHPELSDAEIYDKLSMGIEGNIRGLRSLGIIMSNKALQDEADHIAHGLKIKDMTDEQLVVLRTQFLMDETLKLQQAGTDASLNETDALKKHAASWQDIGEVLGKIVLPFFNTVNEIILETVDAVATLSGKIRDLAGAMITLPSTLFGGASYGDLKKQSEALSRSQALTDANLKVQMGWQRDAKGRLVSTPQDKSDFWAPHGGDGGKKLAEELKKVEDEIFKALDEEAKRTADMLKDRREELMLKERLGVLSSQERTELDRINNRLEFKKNLVEETTQEWQKQVELLKQADDKIASLSKRIADEQANLKQHLADLDTQAADEKVTKAADVLRRIKEIRDKQADPLTLSPEESYKIGTLQSQLVGYDAGTLEQAQKLAGMTEAQLIDYNTQQKKQKAEDDAAARIKPLKDELAQEQANRDAIVQLEEQKKTAVLDALRDRAEKTKIYYDKVVSDTEAFVQTQQQQFSRLAASVRTPVVAAPRFASGGPVFGPGGPTDDQVPALLSSGEFVVNARAYSANKQIVEAINAGFHLSLPRFAQGGPVNTDNSRTAHVTIHNHGEAARVMARPDLARWHWRLAVR